MGSRMIVFGLAGWSGSGKTTLMEKLLGTITARGITVSTVKHTHGEFDIDRPGKDSYRHREAGASEVMMISGRRWALLHELRDAAEPSLEDLMAHMSPVDLVLIEGYKAYPHAKLEVYRRANGKPPLWPNDPTIIGVATDEPLSNLPLPQFDLNTPSVISEFILAHTGLAG
jgi:molybdopterin-guanine dinucleotide biosynthesis protein B